MRPSLVGLPPGGLYRVGRRGRPLAAPLCAPLVASDSPVLEGGRFDPPWGYVRVLYTASSEEAAFAETLAPFRAVAPEAAERLAAQEEADDDEPSSLLLDLTVWTRGRSVVWVEASGDGWRLVDLAEPETHAYLTGALAQTLAEHGLREFDRGVVMSQDRRLTRPVGGAVFGFARSQAGVAGIHFESRLAREYRCQALFGAECLAASRAREEWVDLERPALRAAAGRLGVTLS